MPVALPSSEMAVPVPSFLSHGEELGGQAARPRNLSSHKDHQALSSPAQVLTLCWLVRGKKDFGGSVIRNPPAVQESRVRPLGREDPLQEEMATYSSILAWEIPWIEKSDGLQSMGLQRVRDDLATK